MLSANLDFRSTQKTETMVSDNPLAFMYRLESIRDFPINSLIYLILIKMHKKMQSSWKKLKYIKKPININLQLPILAQTVSVFGNLKKFPLFDCELVYIHKGFYQFMHKRKILSILQIYEFLRRRNE